MQLLEVEQWPLVGHIITEDIPFVVISMLYQRRAAGQIWVDNAAAPKTVVAAFPKDFYARGDLLNDGAQKVLCEIKGTAPETTGLRRALQQAWGSFALTPSILHAFRGAERTHGVPAGYRAELITSENIQQVLDFWREEFEPHTVGDFLDVRDLLHHGFGACVIHEVSNRCVSACAAISVSRQRCDFGLDTAPGHEGLGLTTACSSLAVNEAVRRHKRPVWVTDWDNYASQRVAAKIGFVKSVEFEIYKRLTVASLS